MRHANRKSFSTWKDSNQLLLYISNQEQSKSLVSVSMLFWLLLLHQQREEQLQCDSTDLFDIWLCLIYQITIK